MKPAILLATLATALLAGCASTPPSDAAPKVRGVDQAYIDTIDRHATRAGVRVHWINPPRRKRAEEESDRL